MTATATPTRVKVAGAAESVWDDARRFYAPNFPSSERLAAIRENLREAVGVPYGLGQPIAQKTTPEGSIARLHVAPGLVRISYRNNARWELTAQRAADQHHAAIAAQAAYLARGEEPPQAVPTRVITGWSRKSRVNFWEAMHELDYSGWLRRGNAGVPAMITLTYPREWLKLAPNGREVKRHMRLFRKRFERAWGYYDLDPVTQDRGEWVGTELRGVWKLEFQRRGAPHLHMMIVPPHGRAGRGRFAGLTFKHWLSATWADICTRPNPARCGAVLDPDTGRLLDAGELGKFRRAGTGIDYSDGLKASDPRKVSVYFAKHGAFSAKEYQHNVPVEWQHPGAGPGRFWGYWGLKRAAHAIEIPLDLATAASRVLRRWSRAQGITREVAAVRYRGGQLRAHGEIVGLAGAQEYRNQPRAWRKQRRRARRMTGKYGAGWVSFNDGAAAGEHLLRYLAAIVDPASSPARPGRKIDDTQSLARAAREAQCIACGRPLAEVLAIAGVRVHFLCVPESIRNPAPATA